MNKKISIVIPVFNTEKYLRECLDSVLNQTNNDNLEIIVVDDCSQGNCQEIVEEYQKKYGNIVYKKHLKNKGLFIARETGIRAATGEYIISLDSDDQITPNLIEEIRLALSKYSDDVDLVSFNSVWIYKDYCRRFWDYNNPDKEYRGSEVFQAFCDRSIVIWMPNRMVKRDLCIKIFDILNVSDHLTMAEDCLFFMCYTYFAQHYIFCSKGFYLYNMQNPSVTRVKYNNKRIKWHKDQLKIVKDSTDKFCASQNIDPNVFHKIYFELAEHWIFRVFSFYRMPRKVWVSQLVEMLELEQNHAESIYAHAKYSFEKVTIYGKIEVILKPIYGEIEGILRKIYRKIKNILKKILYRYK